MIIIKSYVVISHALYGIYTHTHTHTYIHTHIYAYIIHLMVINRCVWFIYVVDDEIDMASVNKADAIDPEREAYYRDDPKKALQRFFDREGMYQSIRTTINIRTYVHTFMCSCSTTCVLQREN